MPSSASRGLLGGAVAVACVLAACGPARDPIPLAWLGTSGGGAGASTAASVFWIQADVDGTEGPDVIVDTGAPLSILNPKAFPSGVREGASSVATLAFAGITLWRVPVVGLSEKVSYTPEGNTYGGILGFTAYGQFATSFNYRDREIRFGAGQTPEGVLAAETIPFRLEGGGYARAPDGSSASWVVAYPASRVLVSAVLEGHPRTLLVDTGASWIGLGSTVFAELVSDGRAVLTDDAMLEAGATTASVSRLRSISLAGAEVVRPVAASGSGIDTLLGAISAEVGRDVDGMLGAPFLREFLVTVDYPGKQLVLAPYTTRDHIHDTYQRVGIELSVVASASGRAFSYRVARVFENTDADAQKVLLNEHLVAIDGQDLATLPPALAEELLLGSVGTQKKLRFEQRTLSVRVDDLLPLP